MSEDINETMSNLLLRCMPYLTSAKTGFDLPEHLKKDNAGKLQKEIDTVLRVYFEQRNSFFCAAIDKAMEAKLGNK